MSPRSKTDDGEMSDAAFAQPITIRAAIISQAVRTFGGSLVFLLIAWLVWQEMNKHIDGRFTSQDERIGDQQKQIETQAAEIDFLRGYMAEEQAARRTLFNAIESHLAELTRRYHLTPTDGTK